MSAGGPFWARHFARAASGQVTTLRDTLVNRLLPTFADIEGEATRYSEEVYAELGSQRATENGPDLAEIAEIAQDQGIARYEALSGARQSLLNAFTVTLYHQVEQQLLFFLRRHVLHPAEEGDLRLAKLSILVERLGARGIDLTSFAAWPKLEELRRVANVIKHADGGSATELRALRPDMFSPAILRTGGPRPAADRPIYMPMAGEDLYVDEPDFETYVESCLLFYRELATEIT